MVRFGAIATLACLAIVVLFAFPPRVLAYLDPGTGSYLVQVLLASLLAVALTVRLFWRHIRGFLKGLVGRGRREPEGRADEG